MDDATQAFLRCLRSAFWSFSEALDGEDSSVSLPASSGYLTDLNPMEGEENIIYMYFFPAVLRLSCSFLEGGRCFFFHPDKKHSLPLPLGSINKTSFLLQFKLTVVFPLT